MNAAAFRVGAGLWLACEQGTAGEPRCETAGPAGADTWRLPDGSHLEREDQFLDDGSHT